MLLSCTITIKEATAYSHQAISSFEAQLRSQQNSLDLKHVPFLNFIRIICSSSLFHQCWSCDEEAEVVPHFPILTRRYLPTRSMDLLNWKTITEWQTFVKNPR